MENVCRREAERLFQQVVDLPLADRPAYLDKHCPRESGIRKEVDLLLDRFENPAVPSLQALDQLDEAEATAAGQRIGPYKLLEAIGEGGFGAVYLAEQQKPVRRRVALKIVKLGMDTKHVVARFEAERQALAMMDHPGIAKVFDGGATDTGRPYFVMELVKGTPITEYCDTERLPTRQRLNLFVQVCRAVQHAHQKGIIHRDIKPSNVLITLHDGAPIPKIIDFGIAKAMHEPLTDKTIFTRFRQFVGTPEYVSPEQAAMNGLDVDTRTDVYSLGVLLYELLTGRTPFDGETLRSASYEEVLRIIREQTPDIPSRYLNTLGPDGLGVAWSRRTEPRALRRLLCGDLDWIVMKALEKDCSRRYDSAAILALDIERHLNHEPVSAGPPSAVYQLRKLIARHKAAFGFVMALFVLITGFGVWMVLLYAEANRLHHRAEANLARARTAEENALAQAETAEHIAEILADLFDIADPFMAETRTSKAQQILDQAARRVREELRDKPETQAALLHAMGRVCTNLGLYPSSISLLRHALRLRYYVLGNNHPDTVASMNSLGKSLMYYHELPEAESQLREALEIGRRVLGEDHPVTIASIGLLSWTLQYAGKVAEAEPLCWRELEVCRRVFGNEDARTVGALNALSWVLQRLDRAGEAEVLSREALDTSIRVFGEETLYTAESMDVLGVLLMRQGRLDDAEPLLRKAAQVRKYFLSGDHPEALMSARNAAELLWHQGRAAEAETHLREVLAGYRRVRGDRCRDTHECMALLGRVLLQQDRLDEAEDLLHQAFVGLRRDCGEACESTLNCRRSWVAVLHRQNRLGEAERPLRESLAKLGHALGKGHPATLGAVGDLALALRERGQHAEAEGLLREHLTITRDAPHQSGIEIARAELLLGACLTARGRFDEAETRLLQSYPIISAHFGEGHEEVCTAIGYIVELYERRGKAEQAAAWRSRLTGIPPQ